MAGTPAPVTSRPWGLYAWLSGLALLPVALLVLDPHTEPLRVWLNSIRPLAPVMDGLRFLGKFDSQLVALLLAFLLMLLFRWKPARRWLVVTLAAILLSAVPANLIKLAVRRERPPVTSDRIEATTVRDQIATGKCMSFPSGDTSSVFAIAVVLVAFAPRTRTWALLVASMVGLSRIYCGAHYIADVLAGALVGSGMGHLVVLWCRRRGAIIPAAASRKV
jgi:membrane-associated phospholipid phosphatase